MTDDDQRTDEELAAERRELVAALGGMGDMTPGSFQEEWGRCGKPKCHCAKEGDQGHGPHRSVLRYQGGKTVKRAVPAPLADVFKARVARWDEFNRACARIGDIDWELSVRELGRAKRVAPTGGPPARAGEKRGSPAGTPKP
ncbi:MAG: hypothetical protein LBJ02_01960 [Bifidobacteriaceae bacterium]|jgi:hypothetical protein|nr:hypothetical protein [Bifidobacteriaceae bacterium]